MRIAISTLVINRDDFGGGEIYLSSLLRNLEKLDTNNEYFIFVSPQNRDKFHFTAENFHPITCKVNNQNRLSRIVYEQTATPRLKRQYGIDIFHAPNNILPLRPQPASVVTIQCMINYVMPSYSSQGLVKRLYFNSLMGPTIKKANKIIAVSNNLKEEILNRFQIPECKVAAIHHGVDDIFFPRDGDQVNKFLAERKINRPYLLCVANNVGNKNLQRLVKAFDLLKGDHGIPHQLVLAGSVDQVKKEKNNLFSLLESMKNIRCDKEVIFTGYVDRPDLPYLFSGADLFVYPSLCESFGIPLIEAMSCGVPIVTSNMSVMPEVVGDAAYQIDPYDCREIAKGVNSVLDNASLRNELRERGLQRAKKFTWEKAAQETIKVYEAAHLESANPV